MGEIADYMIEQMQDDAERDLHEFYNEVEVKCKYCGSHHVVWEMTPAGWRLFNTHSMYTTGALHECCDPFKIVKQLEKKNVRR